LVGRQVSIWRAKYIINDVPPRKAHQSLHGHFCTNAEYNIKVGGFCIDIRNGH